MEANARLSSQEGDILPNATQFHQLVSLLVYLMVTRPDITFAVNKLSQFMTHPADCTSKCGS